MIIVRGSGSKIAQELNEIVPICGIARDEDVPLTMDQTPDEIREGFFVNCGQIVRDCELLIKENHKARICVIGSESAWAGSYDGVYARAKADLHRYVEKKRLRTTAQQLVCIAPGVIQDAGMCARRVDLERLDRRREVHPQKRFLWAIEVARLVHYVLCIDRGYLSGVVIRMNGGEHT
jgi:NAD(P)-dependent dehydrogenase (short-subunit alcohol dehydrogenase family)